VETSPDAGPHGTPSPPSPSLPGVEALNLPCLLDQNTARPGVVPWYTICPDSVFLAVRVVSTSVCNFDFGGDFFFLLVQDNSGPSYVSLYLFDVAILT
jgi:hypothetical protein